MKKILENIVSIFLPFRCHVCRENCDFLSVICSKCLKNVVNELHAPQEVDDVRFIGRLFTLSSYNSCLADVIRLVKYRPSKRLMYTLLKQIENLCFLKELLKEDDIVIPVPMHNERFEARGFNQADMFAVKISGIVGCHYSEVLTRIRHTRPQADCDEEERLTNLSGAFALADGHIPEVFKNRRLILVDDVATTGSTLQHCAETLKSLCPEQIVGLVICHSYRRNRKQAN